MIYNIIIKNNVNEFLYKNKEKYKNIKNKSTNRYRLVEIKLINKKSINKSFSIGFGVQNLLQNEQTY